MSNSAAQVPCKKCGKSMDVTKGEPRFDYAKDAAVTVIRLTCPHCGHENFLKVIKP